VISDTIIVVSGLPRSGTSMMMRMLDAGGVALLSDVKRAADEDNPRGYFEDERTKDLARDQSWVGEARGKAVKVISALLEHLPPSYRYKIVFMRRDLDEVVASQDAMLVRRGKKSGGDAREHMRDLFAKHLDAVERKLAAAPNVELVYVDYAAVLGDPASQAARVNAFLGGGFDEKAMTAAVEPALRRQRRR
jgi:hypothetical protein